MKKIILLLAVLGLIVVMSSCQKAEEVTVSKYFQAMQHNDKDTMATMSYEPKDVEYKAFEILSIEEPVISELALPGLLKKAADLEKGKRDQVLLAVGKDDELADAEDELDETRRRSKRAELQTKIEELQAQAEEEKQKVKTMQLEINQVNKEIEREKALIALSTSVRDNLEMFSGETHTYKVTAKVTLENDEVQNYIFLLRKDVLKLEDRQTNGRLVIVKIMSEEEMQEEMQAKEEAAASQTEEVTEEEPATEEKKEEETTG